MKTGALIAILGGGVVVGTAGLVVLGVTIADRMSASGDPGISEARANCELVYSDLPRWVDNLAEQTGQPADTATPCDNWIESKGEAAFIEFWTTPSQYIPSAMTLAKLEALDEAGLSD